jgi:hypothetical protein
LPLAVYAKSLGAFGIHCGGGTQLIFGIIGARWDNHPIIKTLRNDAWVRPSADERPPRFKALDDGSYW